MRFPIHITIITLFSCLAQYTLLYAQQPEKYFKIKVVDRETGRGVPLVELKTVNHIRHVTDNNGIIAFYEPGLMGQEVYFHVKSHGYEYPKSGLGYQGLTCRIKSGDSVRIEIDRTNIAERIYRITGQGLYHHSVLLGEPTPIREPTVNGQVTGQDWGHAIPYKNKIYWFWGDTNKASHPLGNFSVSGATSLWPDQGGLDPNIGITLSIKDTLENVSYTLSMLSKNDKLSGTFKGFENNYSGAITCNSNDHVKDLFSSPHVVGLYEYYDNTKKEYFYSTKPTKTGMKRSEKPICYVWENPSTSLVLDDKAKKSELNR
ncbi:MAG: hypothetical protein MI975_17830 [Cytophagales bacterium]|nr:hypothetical protein [Cytophagales bacterium]